MEILIACRLLCCAVAIENTPQISSHRQKNSLMMVTRKNN